jgi:hypothetical protein
MIIIISAFHTVLTLSWLHCIVICILLSVCAATGSKVVIESKYVFPCICLHIMKCEWALWYAAFIATSSSFRDFHTVRLFDDLRIRDLNKLHTCNIKHIARFKQPPQIRIIPFRPSHFWFSKQKYATNLFLFEVLLCWINYRCWNRGHVWHQWEYRNKNSKVQQNTLLFHNI